MKQARRPRQCRQPRLRDRAVHRPPLRVQAITIGMALVLIAPAALLSACASTAGTAAAMLSSSDSAHTAGQHTSAPAIASGSSSVGTSGSQALDGVPPDVARVLLAPSDTAADFTTTYSPMQMGLPCHGSNPAYGIPLTTSGGVHLENAQGFSIDENIEVFRSSRDAHTFQVAVQAGLGCSRGTDAVGPFTVSGPTNLSTIVTTKVDAAQGWSYSGADARAAVVLIRIARMAVFFEFSGASTLAHPEVDPRQAVNLALTKIARIGLPA